MRSRTIKVIATVFGVVVIGLLAISLLIKTGFMQQKLIGAIKKAVRNSTGHMLEIGKVDFAVRRGVV
ncbi:MAG: hypothetical protein GTN99_03245, partial [Candidatus Dadabacteria bacterium]|nr:hypothetical protein [Candidatus Dadabacteria bacterium]